MLQEVYCAKSIDDDFCMPEWLQMDNATGPTIEMLDVSSFLLVPVLGVGCGYA